jgi:hypothetical protein
MMFIMAAALSGCTQIIELTNEEEDLVAEYAAGRMINYYRECTGEIPKASETVSAEQNTSDQQTADNQNQSAGQSQEGMEVSNTLEDLLNISGVELSLVGYSVNDKYPTDEYSFSVEAPSGYKLLVVEYELKNNSAVDTVIGVDASHASIKALVNNTESAAMYRTMLKSDITNMDGTSVKAGESVTGVLIFRIKEDLAENVNSVDVSVTAR